jgi:hypothetical protein
MGTVLLAYHTDLKRHFVIKILRDLMLSVPGGVARALTEARAIAAASASLARESTTLPGTIHLQGECRNLRCDLRQIAARAGQPMLAPVSFHVGAEQVRCLHDLATQSVHRPC